MPYVAGLYSVEKANDIRRRANLANAEADRDFWMKEAERLHEEMRKIFEDAATTGKLSLSHEGQVIRLVKAQETPPAA